MESRHRAAMPLNGRECITVTLIELRIQFKMQKRNYMEEDIQSSASVSQGDSDQTPPPVP